MNETTVDLAFTLVGKELSVDHGYGLFAALSRLLPDIRSRETWGIHPIRGRYVGDGALALDSQSLLKVRLPGSDIASALPLAGKSVTVDGKQLRIGIPTVYPLEPAAMLRARMVVIKGAGLGPRDQEDAARKSLADGVRIALSHLPLGQDPERVEVTVARRHVLRVGASRERTRRGDRVTDRDVVVGFQVALSGLEAQASLAVQMVGIGGKRHMGCGIFVPPTRRR